jgi:ubiquinone/menaquinone biosynthesis C-methylase UbiE
MADKGSLAGLETFDKINIDYEKAYENNNIKKACISQAISLLPPSSRVLDVGCGTGVPVASTVCRITSKPL